VKSPRLGEGSAGLTPACHRMPWNALQLRENRGITSVRVTERRSAYASGAGSALGQRRYLPSYPRQLNLSQSSQSVLIPEQVTDSRRLLWCKPFPGLVKWAVCLAGRGRRERERESEVRWGKEVSGYVGWQGKEMCWVVMRLLPSGCSHTSTDRSYVNKLLSCSVVHTLTKRVNYFQ
jgi:hypothetical protein